MFDGNSSDGPNLFAFAAKPARHQRRKAVYSALKLLLLATVALSITLALGSFSRSWLVTRLTSDFETLTSVEKQHRLSQLSALGQPAIEPLVRLLCDEPDDAVARTAYELLRDQQSEWMLLDRSEAISRHAALVGAMDAIAIRIADDRTNWTTSLLQQSIAISVNRGDEPSARLYAAATEMLDRMSLSERSGPSILVDGATEYDSPKRLTVLAQPLPVAPSDSIDNWTDWPPVDNAPPTVYRSAAGLLRAVAPDDDVMLADIHQDDVSSNVNEAHVDSLTPKNHNTIAAADPNIRPAALLVESPLESYDTNSVIHWLGNSHEPLRVAAKTELMRRGLQDYEIAIATRIAAGDLQTKLELVDAIAHNESIDPRPWLLLLLNDPSRDVKLKTVSVLATMTDPAIERELRNHIIDEPDPTVAFRIRRLLDLR